MRSNRRFRFSAILLLAVLLTLLTQVSTYAAAINRKTATIWVGDTLSLSVSGVSASKVKWSSGKSTVATVTSAGKVKGIKAGSAVITGKVGTKKYTCKVTVKTLPSISARQATLRVGDRLNLKMNGVGNTKVTWSSGKASVAAVSAKGAVTALKTGSATITAKVGTKKFSCKVTVKAVQMTTTTTTVTRPSSSSNTGGSVSTPVVDTASSYKLTSSTAGLSAEEARVYKILYGFRTRYPEGTRYTNADYYQWKGGIYRGGYGCAGFAFMLSDAAFGDELADIHIGMSNYDFNKLKVGDILRVDYDTHTVIVMKKVLDGVIVAEGNYNSSVHWGRFISFAEIRRSGTNVITRYTTSTLAQKLAVWARIDSLPVLF